MYEVAVIGDLTLFTDPLFPCTLSTIKFSAGGGFRSVTVAVNFVLCSCLVSVFTTKQGRNHIENVKTQHRSFSAKNHDKRKEKFNINIKYTGYTTQGDAQSFGIHKHLTKT